jgi:hypothetical protein
MGNYTAPGVGVCCQQPLRHPFDVFVFFLKLYFTNDHMAEAKELLRNHNDIMVYLHYWIIFKAENENN